MIDIIKSIDGVLWGPWAFFVLMAAGILFTIWTKFGQYRALTHGVQVIRGCYDNPDDPGAINHFQALAAALSATVGLGNIGGVALAIGLGGPGALFWMWVIGFLGMALKTVEITLAMMYRDTSDPDNPHGGAMWVIKETLGKKGGHFKTLAAILGGFFCITLIISTMTGGNMFQSWNVAALTEQYFGVPLIATSIVLAMLVGAVIVGGIKRIGSVAGRIVPFMIILYILAGLAVLGTHVTELPGLLGLVVTSAFEPTQATGAFIGAGSYFAFTIGLRRALFSNEAGQGSAPIAHSAAKTDEPAREGVVGGIGPFIDTILICTLTALVILSTGAWNRDGDSVLEGPTSFVQVEPERGDEGLLVFAFDAPTSLEQLPPPAQEEWSAGMSFYLVAAAEGGEHGETGGNRVRVNGGIIAAEEDNAELGVTAGDLVIEWKPVKLDPNEWTATPTAVHLVDASVYRVFAGAPLTAHAFDLAFPGLGKWLVTFAAWLFAFSTMISWSYYGEQGVVFLGGKRWVLPYKLLFLGLVIVAPYAAGDGTELGHLIDFGTGWMLWANLPIVILMGFLAVRSLNDYFKRLKAGEFPSHSPPSILDVISGKDRDKKDE